MNLAYKEDLDVASIKNSDIDSVGTITRSEYIENEFEMKGNLVDYINTYLNAINMKDIALLKSVHDELYSYINQKKDSGKVFKNIIEDETKFTVNFVDFFNIIDELSTQYPDSIEYTVFFLNLILVNSPKLLEELFCSNVIGFMKHLMDISKGSQHMIFRFLGNMLNIYSSSHKDIKTMFLNFDTVSACGAILLAPQNSDQILSVLHFYNNIVQCFCASKKQLMSYIFQQAISFLNSENPEFIWRISNIIKINFIQESVNPAIIQIMEEFNVLLTLKHIFKYSSDNKSIASIVEVLVVLLPQGYIDSFKEEIEEEIMERLNKYELEQKILLVYYSFLTVNYNTMSEQDFLHRYSSVYIDHMNFYVDKFISSKIDFKLTICKVILTFVSKFNQDMLSTFETPEFFGILMEMLDQEDTVKADVLNVISRFFEFAQLDPQKDLMKLIDDPEDFEESVRELAHNDDDIIASSAKLLETLLDQIYNSNE
ncbi:hypothetical protein TVAG_191190 [Trichomonas vaginalis G3]|uniref:Uncharacterized protein n=1 Tax=Trichomonas vaginalis (strain ATCC PRA-98 / G3) TaxID=412133 RepID=A2EFK2_TRIV3|nr:armadillo (ARM) repeat-containing protein family [Trichomonas vaginalis G3]EAY08596.1 hypothetical protein TVAG_191190 [Trichomonas vaginalis G3]KAI5497897.1 armadillo (ARM) repeat-containing protein family [Trichomonas vaginalis G3]|eukprot:XP_001320819.1 hypothetical protein [Trichomonas vaginalis G3]